MAHFMKLSFCSRGQSLGLKFRVFKKQSNKKDVSQLWIMHDNEIVS